MALPPLGEESPNTAALNWGSPANTGAAFDFRSKLLPPSSGMLKAIAETTLNDDVYGEDITTSSFEREMASLCGHEAGAFVVTGTMANQLAVCALLGRSPQAVLAAADSHLLNWESGGVAQLSGAMVQPVHPQNGRYLTLEDVTRHGIVSEDIHKCPTRVVSIENTASGTVVPLGELERIRSWARRRRIGVHIDGARLWEAVAAGAGSLRGFAACADALTLDFSKNLGAPMGAMVLGSSELIGSLKRIRKGIGGGMRQAGVLSAAARQAVVENFGLSGIDTRGILARSHASARVVGQMWTRRGGKLLREVETNMVWLDLASARVGSRDWNAAGQKHGIKVAGKRILLHHQICEAAIDRLGYAMDDVLRLSEEGGGSREQSDAGVAVRAKL